jgi:DNA polymerase I-like protein with 3'-5' exonuclease and polymerase domains
MFRGLVAPKQGKVIIACDYGQQEFLVGALLSGDKKMLEAYKSGDPYVYFAKAAKAIPPEGTKKTHPEIRDRFKSSVLGMQYGMGQVGLGSKITADTGVYTTPEEAKKIIDQFNSTFIVFAEWKRNLIREYDTAQREGIPYTIKLPCGWRMCGDNNNMLSVANVPIQGFGASAMRFSVIKAMEDGLDVIQTLHDAIYAEADVETWEEDLDKLLSAMAYGFERALACQYGGKLPSFAMACRNDPCAWGPDLANGEAVTPSGIKVKTQTQYADPRVLNKDGSYKDSVRAMVHTAWPEGGDDLEELDL